MRLVDRGGLASAYASSFYAILASVEDWNAVVARETERFQDGTRRLPRDGDQLQRQLTRIGNAAYGAGLAFLMLGDPGRAANWLKRAADTYRESLETAPPGSWGRFIGSIKACVMAGDWPGAERYARLALEAGAADAASPIGRYAASLAALVVGDDVRARMLADTIHGREDFPEEVADALRMVAAGDDVPGYILAVEGVLESFETRGEYLEDVPVADTVLVLQALARRRGFEAALSSQLLPS